LKLEKNTFLNRAQQEQELLCGLILALVGMYILLRNLSKFIQVQVFHN
jgi:putative Mn2+ efflux pump MntP